MQVNIQQPKQPKLPKLPNPSKTTSTNDIHFQQKVPYGVLIALSILVCVYLNDRFENRRCVFILLFLLPNIAGSFGLRFVSVDQTVGRLICYYLTGPYNAAFVMVLSMQVANTAGELGVDYSFN